MDVNADFGARVAVHAAGLAWVPSPAPGVERRMLDRMGEEVARATSIVRYGAGSRFPPHRHDGGEEFLVLEGVFSDESGDMPAGTCVRNPPGTAHAPASPPGCTIFVKLWQFDPADDISVRLDTRALAFEAVRGRKGVEATTLHRDVREHVRLERWAPGAAVDIALPGGGEFLVLDGGFREQGDSFGPGSWLRLPANANLIAEARRGGCRLWIKTGHLAGPMRLPESDPLQPGGSG